MKRKNTKILKSKSRYPESALQMQVVQWFRYQHTQYAGHFFAIPNEAKRSFALANRLRKMGMLSGVSDLFLAVPRSIFHGMFIELKAGKNKATPAQVDFMLRMRAESYRVVVLNKFEDVVEEINSYLSLDGVKCQMK